MRSRRSRPPIDPTELAAAVRAGDRRAVARAISAAEDGDPAAGRLLAALYPHTGHARTLGLTGPPGVGKSSLIDQLCAHLRGLDLTVGVLSVDPSSHRTHGALLGDRIRLSRHFLDPGVFIRSMATRGHLGGVSEATMLAGLILDAAGRDVVLYETVGVGQSEVEIGQLVDTVVLVLMPGSGDSIQALKAGVMEIPDIICINKADHPRLDRLRAELKQVLGLADPAERPLVVETTAIDGSGVPELWEAVCGHRDRLAASGGLEARRRAQLEREVLTLAAARVARRLERTLRERPDLAAVIDAVAARTSDPLAAVEALLADHA